MGRRDVREERQGARRQHRRGRGHGHLQLRLRQDRGAGPEPGPDGPMLMVSHANTNPGLTKTWDSGRAGQVLPDAASATTPASSPLTTTRVRRPRSSPRRTEGEEVLHPQRQPDLRPGRGEGVRGRGRQEGHHDPRQRRRGTPSSPTTRRCSRRSRRPAPTASSSAASTTTTVASWSRTRSRSSATTPRSS